MDKIKYYGLVVLIAILYTSISFYGANTLFHSEEFNCWDKFDTIQSPDLNEYNNNETNAERQKCLMQEENEQNKNEKNKMILIGAINVILLIIIILIKLNLMGLGLLIGILLSSIIASISYYKSNSIIGLLLLIVLFITVVAYITKKVDK